MSTVVWCILAIDKKNYPIIIITITIKLAKNSESLLISGTVLCIQIDGPQPGDYRILYFKICA